MIPVTKPYLPAKEKYKKYIDDIYESGWLTNNGPLCKELEERLAKHLDVKNLILVANGTLALQVVYKALELEGEVITSPFSFVATTSSLVWEGLKPIFADIDPATFNIDPSEIEQSISSETSAIVPVHVFGNPCQVEQIQIIADRYNSKVIYDAAHAFDVSLRGESVLNFGNASTLSFHATKLFHSIEGGAVITNDDQLAEKIRLMINFGIAGKDSIELLGINAKMNEFEAAMGLCVLDEIEKIKAERRKIIHIYQEKLAGVVRFQKFNDSAVNNGAYVPALFESEAQLLKVQQVLLDNNVTPRRYFYPSLDTLEYCKSDNVCEISKDISSRVLCLPLYVGLNESDVISIINVIKREVC